MSDTKIILLPVGSYIAGNHLAMVTDSNTPYRIPLSAFAEGDHDHEDEAIKPELCYAHYFRGKDASDNYTEIGGYGGSPYIRFGQVGSLAGYITHYATAKHRFTTSGHNAFELWGGAVGERTAIADAWNTYACSIENKSDVETIPDPLVKIEKIKGITFLQDGVPGTGISAEDLETLDLPGTTHKDKDGKYESVNLTLCIPLIIEGIKDLVAENKQCVAEINDLTERIGFLEGQI